MFDTKTIVAVASYLAITGLLNLAIGHRSQIDSWAESKPRVAAALKLLRGFGFDPWLIIQALSLAASKRLPAALRDPVENTKPTKVPPLPLLVLALALVACSDHVRPGANATPLEAAVVIMRSELADFDDTGNTGIVQFPACNGVAVGSQRILTARHCLLQDPIFYVDAETWDTTSNGKALASVDPGTAEVASLTTRDELQAWIRELAPPRDGAATVVHLRDTEIVEDQASIEGTHVSAPMTDHGDSGSGVFQDGALVGILETCDAPDDQTCLGTGGRFNPVVTL